MPNQMLRPVGFAAEVAAGLDVVLRGAEEVGAAGDEMRDGFGDVIQDFTAAVARGGFAFGGIFRDDFEQIFGA
jgi:hypothetical protein